MQEVEANSGDEVSIDTALTGLVHLARLLFQAPAAAFWVQERETERLAACFGDEQALRTAYGADLRSKFEDRQFVVLPDIKAEGEPFEFVAGIREKLAGGLASVTLIIADTKARSAGITGEQRSAFQAICAQAVTQLELRHSQAIQARMMDRLSFFDRMASATQELEDSTAIMRTVARLTGEFLDVSICAYADMHADENGFTIRGDWTAPGSATIVGTYELSDFGEFAVSNLTSNLPLVVDDVIAQLPSDAAATFQSIGIAATICLPLVKDNRLIALMAVHDAMPRIWTDAELSLIREVVERSWAHIERVRAERTLHETSRRLNAILSNTREAVFLTDENQICVYANAAAEQLTGYSFEDMQGRPLHDVVHHKKPDGSHYPIEECPIDRAFPERAQTSGEELFVAPDGSFYPVGFTASPVLDDEGKPIGTVIEARNIAEEKRFQEHQVLLIDELNHRAKNLLAIVQGLVAQTMTSSDPEIRKALEGRLMALAAAHSLLTKKNWEPAPLRQLVQDAIGPHVAGHAVSMEGPELMLPSKTAISMVLAVHELATNAVKYGSLSVPGGGVDVRWKVEGDELEFHWQEFGGPPVVAPAKRGFGSKMLERGLAAELDGSVKIEFLTEGVICKVRASIPKLPA